MQARWKHNVLTRRSSLYHISLIKGVKNIIPLPPSQTSGRQKLEAKNHSIHNIFMVVLGLLSFLGAVGRILDKMDLSAGLIEQFL